PDGGMLADGIDQLGRPQRTSAAAAIELPREGRVAAAAQDLRLLDPVLARDAVAGLELALPAFHVGRRPVRDLRVAGDALRGQPRLYAGVDAADALQVIARRWWRGANGHCSRGLGRFRECGALRHLGQ